MTKQSASAAINIARDSHYEYNSVSGLYERSLLLEGTRQNVCLRSEELNHATWVKENTPTVTDGAYTFGSVTLSLVDDNDAANLERINQVIPLTADGTKAGRLKIKQGTSANSVVQFYDATALVNRYHATIAWAAGVPTSTDIVGTTLRLRLIGSGVYEMWWQAPLCVAANTNRLYLTPTNSTAASTGSTYFGCIQVENAAFPSSYIPTTSAAITRGADIHTRTLGGLTPRAITRYTKFLNRGTLDATSANLRLWQMGGSNTNSLRVIGNGVAGSLVMLHEDAVVGTVSSTATCGAVLGDQVEALAQWYDDGSVQLTAVRNAGTPVVGTRSAAKVPFLAFGADTSALGATSAGAAGGFMAVLNDELQIGIKTLAEMRTLAAA